MLQQVSGFFFYILGLSLFVGYVCMRNDVFPNHAAVWMQTADLPFALAAIVYGGTSLYASLRAGGSSSRVLAWSIAVPLLVLFGLIVTMNFWGI